MRRHAARHRQQQLDGDIQVQEGVVEDDALADVQDEPRSALVHTG